MKYLNYIAWLLIVMSSACNTNYDEPNNTDSDNGTTDNTGSMSEDNIEQFYMIGNEGGAVTITFKPRSIKNCQINTNSAWIVSTEKAMMSDKWLISFKVFPNNSFGRAAKVEITVGDEIFNVGVWQEPRQFNETEEFVDCGGCLGVMFGTNIDNIKRIRNYRFLSGLNADDLSWLRKRLNEAWSGPASNGYINIDMTNCPLSKERNSLNKLCGLPDLSEDEELFMSINNELPSSSFSGNQYLKSVLLYDDLKIIGSHAFDHCINLNRVNLPSQIISVDSYAFNACGKLTQIDFPYNPNEGAYPTFYLQKIGENAFAGIGELSYFIIPESLETIGKTSMPSHIDNLYLMSPEPQQTLNDVIFPNPNSCTLHVPFGSVETYKKSEKWGAYKSIEEMPNNGLPGIFISK